MNPRAGLGVALSGGGAEGLAQLGVLQEMERSGIPIHYVTGTSAGAAIGAVYVTSRDGVEAERRILRHLRTTGIGFDVDGIAGLEPAESHLGRGRLQNARRLWRLSRPREALIGGARMRASLHALLGQATFAGARLPFATTALDLVMGRPMIVAAGLLADAVYASSAIPGLFEPLEVDGHLLVDGAWAEPAPVATCRELGAQLVVAIDVRRDGGPTGGRGALSTALRADALVRELLEQGQLRAADLVVRVRVDVAHFADFSRPEYLIAAGARAAEAMVPELIGLLQDYRAGCVNPGSAGFKTGIEKELEREGSCTAA
jgi:NTE family protein